MSESEILSGTEKVQLGLPFTPDLTRAYDPQPIYRIVLDISYGMSLGILQKGYYIKLNDSIYYIAKQSIEVLTNFQCEKVIAFLKKTQMPFTIVVNSDKTLSGHQYLALYDVTQTNMVYTVKDYEVNRGLWQEIEGAIFENKYVPSVARFTGERLVWYVKLVPEHQLYFEQVATLSLTEVATQGHLKVFKLEKEGEFGFPNYLYSSRKRLVFFNHQINETLDVIPLGSERRIISIPKETVITSDDHEPITIQAGQYLLFHQRPQNHRVD